MPARRVSCLDDDDYDWQMMDQESTPHMTNRLLMMHLLMSQPFRSFHKALVYPSPPRCVRDCLVSMIQMWVQIRHLLHVFVNWGRGQVGTVSVSLRA